MSFLFGGGRPKGEEAVKAYKDQVRSNVREADRELRRMDAQEKALLVQLRKLGRETNIDLARDKAKELVRLRAHRKRLATTREGISALQQSLNEIQSGQKMQEMLARTTLMLRQINCQMDLPTTHRMLSEFARQTESTGAKQEMINEAVDEAFQGEGEGQATEEALTAVLQEAGFDAGLSMPSSSSSEATTENLERRLEALRLSK